MCLHTWIHTAENDPGGIFAEHQKRTDLETTGRKTIFQNSFYFATKHLLVVVMRHIVLIN